MTRTKLVLAAAIALVASTATAEDYNVGMIRVASPWARATPRGAAVAGAYMTISNRGTAPDRLIGGSTPVANRFEIHLMEMDQGVMRMRPVEGGLEIKPGQSVELKPSSVHVMLTGLKQPLEIGQHVKATLEFEKAGKVDIEYMVEAIGANGPAAASSGGAAPMGKMDPGTHTGH